MLYFASEEEVDVLLVDGRIDYSPEYFTNLTTKNYTYNDLYSCPDNCVLG